MIIIFLNNNLGYWLRLINRKAFFTTGSLSHYLANMGREVPEIKIPFPPSAGLIDRPQVLYSFGKLIYRRKGNLLEKNSNPKKDWEPRFPPRDLFHC